MLSKEILAKIAYRYFPTNLEDTYSSIYEESQEFKNLREHCTYFSENDLLWKEFLKKVKKQFQNNEIRDVSLLTWLDRCYTVDIIFNLRKNVISVISLSVSILAPFYVLNYIENDSLIGGVNIPLVSTDFTRYNLKDEAAIIHNIIQEEGFFTFPENILNSIVPNVAFRTIGVNNFTYFNAFFLDEILNRR